MWWWKREARRARAPADTIIRAKYQSFRRLLALNNESLELLAGLQEDLQYVPPLGDIVGERAAGIFERAEGVAAALEELAGERYPALHAAVEQQKREVESYLAAGQELAAPRFAVWLFEVGRESVAEVGGKAASLGEIKNRLRLPAPDGYVLTAEAYRRFCGIPLWTAIRDAIGNADLNDLPGLQAISSKLAAMVMAAPVPRAAEVAITERAPALPLAGAGLAVRSSSLAEGGERTFAGQFVSLLNVPAEAGLLLDAYKRVIAGRFSERALSYRLSTGFSEVESPMAVLFLPVIRARASGIMYTRDPKDPKSDSLWISATRGLALEIASGRMPADLFVLSRRRAHALLEQSIVPKYEAIVAEQGGGLARRALSAVEANAPSLQRGDLQALAEYGLRIEEHFRSPQDVEWAQDEQGKIWVLQSRALALAEASGGRGKSRPRGEAILAGGRTVYPGRVSGPACLIDSGQPFHGTAQGAIVFLRRPSPEIVELFPRIGGLVAEWGNLTGHAAALLREFKLPSVFGMEAAFERLREGEPVSLDAVQACVYRGALWPAGRRESGPAERHSRANNDVLSRRLLALHLLDPAGSNFRPAGCLSTHDVLRFCHEKAIEAMFMLSDVVLEQGPHRSKKLLTPLPVNLWVLDIGGGLALDKPEQGGVRPEQIVSRPFRAFWSGVTHPDVAWTRETTPAALSDLASVMAGSFTPRDPTRALGERSYLLVADEYMNLNSRLAYHFSLLDACLCDVPSNNYISFRFAGGGATRQRRNLRACLIDEILTHYGFRVDRRGDLVNAWLQRAPAEETAKKLDMLGRLTACTSQLDMFMSSHELMKWFVAQFIAGNYAFRSPE
jgi:pyruvate,water dikinase